MEWQESLIITKKWILFTFTATILAGYISDLWSTNTSFINPIPNLVAIIITLAIIAAMITKMIKTQLASAIVIYTLVLNIIFSFYINNGLVQFYEADILRSTLFFTLIITVTGFVSGKLHLLITGCLTILWFTSVLIISKNKFLIDNAFIIFLVILGYTFSLYFLFKKLEESFLVKIKLIRQLEEKSSELENSNQMLNYEKSVSENQKNELESLIESREKLFSIISHDIKNPLSAIIGFSELIESKIEKKDLVKALEFSKVIHHSSTNLHRLLLNLMEWTKMQSGKLAVMPEWIDVNALINESMDISNTSLLQKQIALETKLGPELIIFADKNMITTIVRNLYANAIKFTNKGGCISIESKIENLQFSFSVADTGMGMEANVIDRIMNSKESIATNGTEGEKGTGFGLILCKEFIQLHKGKLLVTSEINKGTVFTCYIPLEYVEDKIEY